MAGIIPRLMRKSVRRARPRRAHTPALRPLLEQILDTPHLAHLVPRLPPDLLHRVIQTRGLEDCWELVALATPSQLARVIDLDVWRPGRPGSDEQFDAERFGSWLEVLLESGPLIAAAKLSQMDANLVIAALAKHARVFDTAASPPASDSLTADVGGYVVIAKRTHSWDAIVTLLRSLEAEHPDFFRRVMRGCRHLSHSGFERDGLHELLSNHGQALFDLASDRERRRERQGYITPAQARAFLHMARQLPLGLDTLPPENPIARAYFDAVESATEPEANDAWPQLPEASLTPLALEASADEVTALADMLAALINAGSPATQPRALLGGPQAPTARLAHIHAHMQRAADGDPVAYPMRSQELAYLANAIVAGCSIQARPFTPKEASDAVAATCNLGLENWPHQWIPASDLVVVFQVGWTVLHHEVAMYAAKRLVRVLASLRCADRDIQIGLNTLRRTMAKHLRTETPWHARDALDVIATLDMPAWATLLGLIDECPVIHAGMHASRGTGTRAVSATAFEFISENSQIASVCDFLESLPETLRG
jgi:hypothetical protein